MDSMERKKILRDPFRYTQLWRLIFGAHALGVKMMQFISALCNANKPQSKAKVTHYLRFKFNS